jgi:hypothetical protein
MDNMPVDVYHRKKNMDNTIGGSGGGGKLAGAVRLISRRLHVLLGKIGNKGCGFCARRRRRVDGKVNTEGASRAL